MQAPHAQPDSVSSKMFLACRGAVRKTIDNRKKATRCRTISRNERGPSSETVARACLGSCVPEGVAGTTTTKMMSQRPDESVVAVVFVFDSVSTFRRRDNRSQSRASSSPSWWIFSRFIHRFYCCEEPCLGFHLFLLRSHLL